MNKGLRRRLQDKIVIFQKDGATLKGEFPAYIGKGSTSTMGLDVDWHVVNLVSIVAIVEPATAAKWDEFNDYIVWEGKQYVTAGSTLLSKRKGVPHHASIPLRRREVAA